MCWTMPADRSVQFRRDTRWHRSRFAGFLVGEPLLPIVGVIGLLASLDTPSGRLVSQVEVAAIGWSNAGWHVITRVIQHVLYGGDKGPGMDLVVIQKQDAVPGRIERHGDGLGSRQHSPVGLVDETAGCDIDHRKGAVGVEGGDTI